jgi:hypothetical protein
MHGANLLFWQYVHSKYGEYFKGKILEVGSYDICGSMKPIFVDESTEYIGVDWRAGPNVDVVSLAHEMSFSSKFGAVISASMLEHDPFWEKSIASMIKYVDENGILVLTWGSALNLPHCLEEAPDGEFHPLKAELVSKLVSDAGFFITELVYDCNLYKLPYTVPEDLSFASETAGKGEINLVAFPKYKEPVQIDSFFKEDATEYDSII